MELRDKVKEVVDYVESLRRELHMHPETAWEENKTQQLIINAIPPNFIIKKVAGTGVVADLILDPTLPLLGFRADIDALKMQEESGLEFASQTHGVAHACGHDMHTASLIGLATMLDEIVDGGKWNDFTHNIRLIFEPAEEAPPGGALKMIGEGALEGVCALIGFHIWSKAPTGLIQIPGQMTMVNCAYSERLTTKIIGKGGHAAKPELANDPVIIARKVMDGLDDIKRYVDRNFEQIILRTRMDDGGTQVNVIPESVIVEATIRCTKTATYNYLHGHVLERIWDIVAAHNALVESTYPEGYQPINNNPTVVDHIRKIISSTNLPTAATDPLLGGESFGHYTQKVPSAFLMIGCGGTSEEINNCNGPHTAMHHSGHFNPDEACLENMLLCQLALALGW